MAEKQQDSLTERGDPLTWPYEPDEEVEQLRSQYPNLSPHVRPRESDEAPSRGGGARAERTRARQS